MASDGWSCAFREGDISPFLKELRTERYDFDETRFSAMFRTAESTRASGFPTPGPLPDSANTPSLAVPETDLNRWLKAMDWPKLEVLHLTGPCPGALQKANRTVLPSLREARVVNAHGLECSNQTIGFIHRLAFPQQVVQLQS
jgi:hypothetical protein